MELRLATEADAAGCLAIYAPLVRDTAISFELEPPSLDEFRRRIAETLARTPWLVGESAGEIRGYAYASPFRARPAYQWTTETTVYVRDADRGRGVGRALYVALLERLRAQGFHVAIGVIALPNPASVRLHEALGFRPNGVLHEIGFKHGRWHDIGFWELALESSVRVPGSLRPVGPG